ncbi:MAG: hypothetical protein AB7E32_09300 [Desulfovibrio sp.]
MVELPFVYKLKVPVLGKEGSVLLDEIKITRPLKAKDLRHIKGTPTMGDLLITLASLAGVPPKLIDELESVDTFHLIGVVTDFFPDSLRTGEQLPESLQ